MERNEDDPTLARLRAELEPLAAGHDLAEELAEQEKRLREDLWRKHEIRLAQEWRRLDLEFETERQRTQREARRRLDAEERPPVEWPQPVTLRALLADPPDPVAWRIEGWWPAGGRVVLAAQAKAGKTTLAMNLVRSLVDGAPFLARDAVTPLKGRVAVLDFEMTERQLVEWYRRAALVNDDRVVVLPMRGRAGAFDLRDDEVRARWGRMLREHDVELVIWDCLRPVMDALALDENHDAGLLLTSFDSLLTDAGGLEGIVVHHTGHAGDRARGDSRIIGWGDANWLIVRDGDTAASPRYISAVGRDVAQSEAQLEINPETGVLNLVGGSRHAARRGAAMTAIVEWLTEADEPLTTRQLEDLAKTHGVPRAAVREGLGSLVALRQVVTTQGEKRAILHALNPQFASAPECADSSPAHQPASVPPPLKAARGTHVASEKEDSAPNGDQPREEESA